MQRTEITRLCMLGLFSLQWHYQVAPTAAAVPDQQEAIILTTPKERPTEHQIRVRDLQDLKKRTIARIDESAALGAISGKSVNKLENDIDDANSTERRFMKDSKLEHKELNILTSSWDQIMNKLSRAVRRERYSTGRAGITTSLSR